MQTGQQTIQALMNQVDQGQLRLPEIQRAYVWKPAQIAGLMDSLYRRYPSGSLLLWKTTEEIVDRGLATSNPTSIGFDKPTFLLDGQQRVTSLHRVYSNHPKAEVVFNPIEEKFQVASAAKRRDPRWVSVYGLLSGEINTFALAQTLAEPLDEFSAEDVFERLDGVKKISSYQYYFELLDDLPYPEVTQVFVRVNSRGRALRDTDLALATLSARWPGVVAKFNEQAAWCEARGYGGFDQSFLVRCLAALAVDTTSPGGFATASIERLELAWSQLLRGLHHTVSLLRDEISIDNSRLIPSNNALVPIVFWLGTRDDAPLAEEERKSLIYWLLVAFMESRYGTSTATIVAQDVGAMRSDKPLENLFRNLGLLSHRPVVTSDRLAGKSSKSPFFLFSYLVARRAKAHDWWYGVPVKLSHDGSYKVEYHHIHPQARLKERYTKAEINDLANLAFISDKANRKIGARSPEVYLSDPSFDLSDLAAHFVPSEDSVRTVEAFPQLLQGRRALLAAAMTEMLDSYRPKVLDDIASIEEARPTCALAFQAYGSIEELETIELWYRTEVAGEVATGRLLVADMKIALTDLADGKGAEVTVDSEPVAVTAEEDEILIPLGPFEVVGSLGDWQDLVERELAEILPLNQVPAATVSHVRVGEPIHFTVADSD